MVFPLVTDGAPGEIRTPNLLIRSRSRCLTITCWSSRIWSHPPVRVRGRSRPPVAVDVAMDVVERLGSNPEPVDPSRGLRCPFRACCARAFRADPAAPPFARPGRLARRGGGGKGACAIAERRRRRPCGRRRGVDAHRPRERPPQWTRCHRTCGAAGNLRMDRGAVHLTSATLFADCRSGHQPANCSQEHAGSRGRRGSTVRRQTRFRE